MKGRAVDDSRAATTRSWPATVPAYTLPNTHQLHACAPFAAAAAVCRAQVPAELSRQVNAAWAQLTRWRTETAVNLAVPWAANRIDEARRQQTEAATSALHLLLQRALITAPTGTRPHSSWSRLPD
nr:hypothetical protein [Streptomyces sp. MBT33]